MCSKSYCTPCGFLRRAWNTAVAINLLIDGAAVVALLFFLWQIWNNFVCRLISVHHKTPIMAQHDILELSDHLLWQ